jgi:CBS domain-containing protein
MMNPTGLAAITVADIMEHRVTTVPLDMPLSEVARQLWEDGISGAPVVDDAGRLAGFISASDIVRFKAYGAPHHSGRVPAARDVMTPATIHVRPTTCVRDLARFLVNARVHRALVVDEGRLMGIVSAFDIVQAVADEAELAVAAAG